MVSDGYFSHGDPSGGGGVDTRADDAGYLPDSRPWVVGEALAWAVDPNATPRMVVNAWMHSSEHRHQLLYTDFRQAGIGIAVGVPTSPAGPGATYTADFGARGAEPVRARKRHHARRDSGGTPDHCSPTSTSAVDFCGWRPPRSASAASDLRGRLPRLATSAVGFRGWAGGQPLEEAVRIRFRPAAPPR